jgi:hypothetical protein
MGSIDATSSGRPIDAWEDRSGHGGTVLHRCNPPGRLVTLPGRMMWFDPRRCVRETGDCRSPLRLITPSSFHHRHCRLRSGYPFRSPVRWREEQRVEQAGSAGPRDRPIDVVCPYDWIDVCLSLRRFITVIDDWAAAQLRLVQPAGLRPATTHGAPATVQRSKAAWTSQVGEVLRNARRPGGVSSCSGIRLGRRKRIELEAGGGQCCHQPEDLGQVHTHQCHHHGQNEDAGEAE